MGRHFRRNGRRTRSCQGCPYFFRVRKTRFGLSVPSASRVFCTVCAPARERAAHRDPGGPSVAAAGAASGFPSSSGRGAASQLESLPTEAVADTAVLDGGARAIARPMPGVVRVPTGRGSRRVQRGAAARARGHRCAGSAVRRRSQSWWVRREYRLVTPAVPRARREARGVSVGQCRRAGPQCDRPAMQTARRRASRCESAPEGT